MAKRKLYDLTMGLFITILMLSNIVAVKLVPIGGLVFTGATFLFPISYIFGDVLTEVYGFKGSRRVIWAGFGANILMVIVFWLVSLLPALVPETQTAFTAILLSVPRVVAASIIAYLCGEFINSVVLSRVKIWMSGKALWVRTISSTLLGELIDTIIFITLAFIGTVPPNVFWVLVATNYVTKCVVEVVLTPVTYLIVNKYKKVEELDTYDVGVKYNPFGLKVE